MRDVKGHIDIFDPSSLTRHVDASRAGRIIGDGKTTSIKLRAGAVELAIVVLIEIDSSATQTILAASFTPSPSRSS